MHGHLNMVSRHEIGMLIHIIPVGILVSNDYLGCPSVMTFADKLPNLTSHNEFKWAESLIWHSQHVTFICVSDVLRAPQQ